ncbi:MAG: hypothetical protein JXR89_01910 [Deltaproteobacteria bacterium]|nr:hypothetical protein [Deltaproteobacteria bacterium]
MILSRRKTFAGIFCLALLIKAASVMASELPYKYVTVRSQYQSLVPGQVPTTRYWRFEWSQVKGEELRLLILDHLKSGIPAGEMLFDQSFTFLGLSSYRYVKGKRVEETTKAISGLPLLAEHTTTPGDWLVRGIPYVLEPGLSEKFAAKVEIAGYAFATEMLLESREISFTEAQSLGMLNDSNSKFLDNQKMALLTVKKIVEKESEVVVRQLWCEGSNFWLYEEKAGRRSWLEELVTE